MILGDFLPAKPGSLRKSELTPMRVNRRLWFILRDSHLFPSLQRPNDSKATQIGKRMLEGGYQGDSRSSSGSLFRFQMWDYQYGGFDLLMSKHTVEDHSRIKS